jgi:dipeptidyl aminopeptidase/acylaminoacyl peptidase
VPRFIKTRSRLQRLALASLLALCAASAPAQSRRIELADLGRIVRLADPQLSPDGKSIAVIVSRANYAQNRYDASLVIVDVASGAQRTVLTGRQGLGSPRWSPKGDRIAFLSTAPSSAAGADARPVAQLFTMLPNGDSVTAVTTAPRAVQQFAWRPDGGAFAYATADEPAQRGTEEGEKFNDSFEIGNDDYLVRAAPTSTHIWLVNATGGDAHRLTSGSWSLPTVRPPGSPPSPITWSPDGSHIAFAKVPSPHSGDFSRSTIQLIDVATGAITAPGGGTRTEGYPTFSPDGKQLAYWYARNGDAGYGRDAFVVPVTGGTPRNVTAPIDRNMARTFWSSDGRSFLVGANDDRRVSLWQVPLDAGAPRKLDLGGVSPNSGFWVDMSYGANGAIAFVGTTPARPAELYYMSTANMSTANTSTANAKPRRLTDLNADVAGLTLGRTESVDWTSSDGVKNNGTLTYPADFDPSRKYPLVLVIHGGPRAATLETFSPQAQLMAARGWIVFQPNYRGSDNLGNAYQRLIDNDAGEGPGRDVIAGIAAVTKRGFVDTTRVAVSGWSYGGFMTSWLIGRYPGRWRAAVSGAPVTDWVDQYDLGDSNVGRARPFGGSPWVGNRRAAYEAQSPMRYAPQIRTPTLVMHDVGDDRVPATQGYKLWHALVDNNVPTQFIAYPINGHNALDPVRARDVQRRWIGWLARYIDERPVSAKP